MATDDAVKAGAHAGNIIKAVAAVCGVVVADVPTWLKQAEKMPQNYGSFNKSKRSS